MKWGEAAALFPWLLVRQSQTITTLGAEEKQLEFWRQHNRAAHDDGSARCARYKLACMGGRSRGGERGRSSYMGLHVTSTHAFTARHGIKSFSSFFLSLITVHLLRCNAVQCDIA